MDGTIRIVVDERLIDRYFEAVQFDVGGVTLTSFRCRVCGNVYGTTGLTPSHRCAPSPELSTLTVPPKVDR